MSDMELKLMPCPCCGSINIEETVINWQPALKCKCGLCMIGTWFQEEELVKKWNNRNI